MLRSIQNGVHMRNSRAAGFGLLEVVIATGILGLVTIGFLGFMSESFRGISSAQRGVNRTNLISALSVAVSDKNTCSAALAGTTVPAAWTSPAQPASFRVPRLAVGGVTLAEVGREFEQIRVVDMQMNRIGGPFPVQYNVAATGSPPDLRAYRRYFAELIITPAKVGGAADNTGGGALRPTPIKLTFLADAANRIQDCFGGIDESDLAAICERAFEGEYDTARYPWCELRHFAVGLHMTESPYKGRLALQEFPRTAAQDATLLMIGNVGGSGAGISFLPNGTGGSAIGAAGLAGRYGNTQVGDLGLMAGKDLHLGTSGTSRLIVKETTGNVLVGTAAARNSRLKVHQRGATSRIGINVHSEDGQGSVLISGVSDAGETYSGLYLSDTHDDSGSANAWAVVHKGPSAANSVPHHAFQLVYWAGSMETALTILPNMNVGIYKINPARRLDVGGTGRFSGDLTLDANMTVAGNVNVSGTVTASSDERLKTDIQPLEKPLAVVLGLNPVSYRWRDNPFSPGTQVGLLAQNVRRVLPDAVLTDEKGFLGVSYAAVTAVIAGAVRELHELISGQDKRLAALEARLEALDRENREIRRRCENR